jgi:hypothetical protein
LSGSAGASNMNRIMKSQSFPALRLSGADLHSPNP